MEQDQQEAAQSQIIKKNINDLPDEVLEFILGLLPPYQDLQACMCVCHRWYDCSKNVMRKTSNKLVKAIAEFKIQWKNITPVDMAPTITKRFSHAACVHDNSMYIFGGCTTNSTAFNDLWRFDLSKRQWIRPLAMGTYPVPKAYTSMARYKENLVLFGGWTYPSPSPYYQNLTMYNEIHLYNVTSNRWVLAHAANSPPQVAGHSAAVIGDRMIVFGGLCVRDNQIRCSNDVWVLDLVGMSWHLQSTSEPRPSARYAQSLVVLDDATLMILGGVQSLNNRFAYNDCWTLRMEGPVWRWREVPIKNKEWAAANIWCNPACRVGDKVVSLSRCKNGRWSGGKPLVTSAVRITTVNRPAGVSARVETSARRPVDKDQNINGKRGILPRLNTSSQENAREEPRAGPSRGESALVIKQDPLNPEVAVDPSVSTGHEAVNRKVPEGRLWAPENFSLNNNAVRQRNMNKPNGMKIVRQLQELNKYRMAAFACDTSMQNTPPENELANQRDLINQRQIAHLVQQPVLDAEPEPIADPTNPQPAVKKQRRNTLTMHVLDISTVLDSGGANNHVTWLRPRQGEVSGAPEELVMYSLVRGNGELIMFGGVHNDINSFPDISRSQQYLYSNSLHFITPPRDII